MSDSWYEVVAGPVLHQGDLISACPVLRVDSTAEVSGEVEVIEEAHDVVVLTQTCDLQNEKVESVLVAAVRDYRALVAQEGASNAMLRSKDFRKAAVRGNLPSYSLLQEREEHPQLGWSLVDFHHLFSVRKSLLQSTATALGDRLRMVPPYREHLAQAFARYIMRVGLPTHLGAFESYPPDAPAS